MRRAAPCRNVPVTFTLGGIMKVLGSANAAIALAVLGWLLVAWGFMSNFGDPPPSMSRADLELARRISITFMFAGGFALLASLWISGHCFSQARKRALTSAALCVIPMLVLYVLAFRAYAA